MIAGGNCRTVMISNVSPSDLTFEDTYNTLKYADRAKRIKVTAVRNVNSGVKIDPMEFDAVKLENVALKEKITQLEKELNEIKKKNMAKDVKECQVQCDFQADPSVPPLKPNEAAEESYNDPRIKPMNEEIEGEKAEILGQKPNSRVDQQISSASDGATLEVDSDECSKVTESIVMALEGDSKSANKLASNEASVLNGEENEPRQNDPEKEPKQAVDREKEDVMRKKLEFQAKKNILHIKHEFAKRILSRSNLVALEGDSAESSKVTKYVQLLKKKLDKAKRRLNRFKSDDEGHNNDLGFEQLRLNVQLQSLLDLLRYSWQEHERTEDILTKALPLLKDRHLLATSFDPSLDNSPYSDLVALIQCTTIQFNETPSVVDMDDVVKVPSCGGLGHIFEELIREEDDDEDGDDEVFDPNISLEGQNLPRNNKRPILVDQNVEQEPQSKRILLNESVDGETVNANDGTFVLEDKENLDGTFTVDSTSSWPIDRVKGTPPKKTQTSTI